MTEGAADRAPLNTSQVGMVWHELLAPGSFNLPALVRRYRGRLDVAALDQALAELTRRHQPLRTTFSFGAGEPWQVVRSGSFPLPVVDLGGMAPAEAEAAAAQAVAEASIRPFDPVGGPLFSPRLLRLARDDHVLVVRLHHAAFDDWSVNVFRREVSALYAAFARGEPSPLEAPVTSFADVCRRQAARLAGGDGERQRAYWRAQMAGAPLGAQLVLGAPHQLGPDRPGAGEPLRHDLPAELAGRVLALAPRLRATPFMTVLAAFGILLGWRSRMDDLVIASVVSGRGTTDVEGLIGCFTRKVLLRLRLEGDPTFPELVARTRGTVLGAMAAPDPAFEEVVQDTLGRRAAANGLAAQVPVVFQADVPQPARLVLPGADVGPFDVPASARREHHFSESRDDGPAWGAGASLGTFLRLSLLEADGGLAFVVRGVFHRPAAEALLEELETLLAEIAAAPDRRLSELAPLDPEPPQDGGDDLVLLGLRLRSSPLEAALRTCPGVADVAVTVAGGDEPQLVAYVVATDPAPTLAELRRALWAVLPGSPWPAAMVLVERLPRLGDGRLDAGALPPPGGQASERPDPLATKLTAHWAAASGRAVTPGSGYWQDFSFLPAIAAARAEGLPITDEQVARCRTPEMLAADVASTSTRSR